MIGKSLRKIIQKLFLMCYMEKAVKIYPAYFSKHNLNYKKQVILLMIPNEEGWHYLAVKK